MACRIVARAAALALVPLLGWWGWVWACGPFFELPSYSNPRHPDRPFERFFEGRLGILQPGYHSRYLLAAYRHLNEVSLTPDEMEVLLQRAAGDSDRLQPTGLDRWLEARREAGADDIARFGVHRENPISNSYYLNCPAAAFERAADTLKGLLEREPVGTVAPWLTAQDQVFSNCPGGASIPAAADNSFSAAGARDRQYQIAAALFYAGRLAESRRRFEAIADDSESRWSAVAQYLVARTLVRESTLSVAEWRGFDRPLMLRARRQLETVLSTPSLAECHAAAGDLLSFVRIRLEPLVVLNELAQKLSRPTRDPTRFEQDVIDFLALLNRAPGGNHPMVRWIRDFRSGALDRLRKAWREQPSSANLVALATHLPLGDAEAPEVLATLDGVDPGSAGWLSLQFHRARLLADADPAKARELASAAVSGEGVPPSARNLLRALQLKLAQDLSEFAAAAPRHAVSLGLISGHEPPALIEREGYLSSPAVSLDADAAVTLTEHLPLQLFIRILDEAAWPEELQVEVARAGWVRAVLLKDWSRARQLARRLQEPDQSLGGVASAVSTETDPDRLSFASTLVLLRHPGLRPYLGAGPRRTEPLAERHSFRDNWWCDFDPEATRGSWDYYAIRSRIPAALKQLYGDSIGSPEWLTPDEREAAQQQWRRLLDLGAAPTLMAQRIVEYGRKLPSDPRLPEALHLAVVATRYGCSDADTGTWSRQAFQMLHRRFPESEWANKTPYWYR